MVLAPKPLSMGSCDGRLSPREWGVITLGALALTVLICVREPDIFGTTDWVRMHSLYKAYIQASVAQGRLPLWNPYHWLGRPFLADIETAFFYPPEWLYLALNIYAACLLTCAIHFCLCLYGAVKLARGLGVDQLTSFFVAFTAGLGIPLAGCFTSGLIHYGQALCYVPVVLYLGTQLQRAPSRRGIALLALALGLQILCGHPQAAWITEVGLVVFLVGRRIERPFLPSLADAVRDLALVGLALVLGLALAGVAVLPLAELASQGNRPASSPAFAAYFSEPLFGWATLLVPTQAPYFHFQANGQLYVGVIVLFAGIAGLSRVADRNARALLTLAAFSGLVAAGESTPLFRILFHIVPGLGWLRIHSRMTFLVSFALVFAAGLWLSQQRFSRRSYLYLAVAALAAVGLSIGFCFAWPDYGWAAWRVALSRVVVISLSVAALVGWMVSRRYGKVMVLAVASVDLLFALASLKQQNQLGVDEQQEQLVRRVLESEGLFAAGAPPPRVFIPEPFRENAGMLYGWSTPYGYCALAPGRVWKYMHEVLGAPAPVNANTFPSLALAKLGPWPYDSMSLVAGVDPKTSHLARNRRPDPRAYVATAALSVPGVDDAIERMRAGHDFHHVALVERSIALPEQAPASDANAAITHFEPERITVTAQSSAPGLLVLAETWFPGWSATVNGITTACFPVNAWMRGVQVPAGTSEVVFTFHSTYLQAGAALSLFALLIIAAFLLLGRGAHDQT
jgi:hypothetical protein